MNTTPRGRFRLLLALTLLLGFFALPSAVQAQTAGFPSVGTRFDSTGSFPVTVTSESAHTYYHPTTMGANGLKHPVIIWGNGTFNSPSTYDAFFKKIASQGFIVAAANTSSSGSGQAMLAGIDNLTRMNGQSGNRFFNKVDLTRIAASGYSQGGGGALAAARDARVDTTMAIQPWRASVSGVRGPALLMSGASDSTVTPSSVQSLFNAAAVPAAYGNLQGATHFEVLGDGGGFAAPTIAWARWYLMGDTIARGYFVGSGCTMCSTSTWPIYRTNARFNADPGAPIGGPITPDPTDPTDPTTPPPTTPPPTTPPPTTCRWYQWWCR